ncbi:MAG: hypothetical protein Q4G63_09980 [Bacteroidia bacterium]|nr:hypothetical protein [Bacteroidia bacterium]
MNKKKPRIINKQLTDIEKFCLNAFLITDDAETAYKLSRPNPSDASDFNVRRMALLWLRKSHVKEYLEERRAAIFIKLDRNDDLIKDDIAELVQKYKNKDFVIGELVRASMGMQGKDLADILSKIANLQAMQKQEEKQPDERIHFYLPLHACNDCPNKSKLVKR